VRTAAAALFDLFIDAVHLSGLGDKPRLTLARLATTLADHRLEESRDALEQVAILRSPGLPLHPDGAPPPLVEAAARLARAALRILEATTPEAAARAIGDDLVAAIDQTDTSLEGDRATRWLARWQRRYSGSAPCVLYEEPRGLCEVRRAFDGDFATRIVVTLRDGAFSGGRPPILDRSRAGRLPAMAIVPVEPLVAGSVYKVDLPAGSRPLREAFPHTVPVHLALTGVRDLAHAVATLRRHLGREVVLGPFSADLAATTGDQLVLHHVGLARAIRDHLDGKSPMSTLPHAQEDGAGRDVDPGPNDVFHLAAFLVTLLIGEGSLPMTAGFALAGPRDDELPLERLLPTETAMLIRRCLRPAASRPSPDELIDALDAASWSAPRPPDPHDLTDQEIEALGERCRTLGAELVQRCLAEGERDAERLIARYRRDALAELRRVAPGLSASPTGDATLQHIVLNQQVGVVDDALNRACRADYGPAVTDHRKRLTRAFAALRKRDLAARQDFGDYLSDGVMRLFDEVRYGDIPRPRGWVLFSKGESRDCRDYGALHISYGAMSGDPYEGCVIGAELARALRDEGLVVRWTGERADPVVLPGFAWSSK